jgi:hypothetical protein
MTTLEIMNDLLERVKRSVSEFPHSWCYISTLGGEQNASILVTVGLDKKETWAHGIFENSRYVRYHISSNRKGIELDCFQFHLRNMEMKKFRRVTLTSTSEKIMERFEKDLKVLQSIM